jgi:hypothetical protein
LFVEHPREAILSAAFLAAIGFFFARAMRMWNWIISAGLTTTSSAFLSTTEVLWQV